MNNRIIYIEHSQTERRTYIGGTTPDEHRNLLAEGFRHDRMANQYRRTNIRRETYIDGVLQADEKPEVANEKAA